MVYDLFYKGRDLFFAVFIAWLLVLGWDISATSAETEDPIFYKPPYVLDLSEDSSGLCLRYLEDDYLESLIVKMLENNQQIKRSFYRLKGLYNVYLEKKSQLSPRMDFTASMGASSWSIFDERHNQGDYRVGLEASYEPDLWGRKRGFSRASFMEFKAAGYDFLFLRMKLITQLISTYYSIANLNDRISFLDKAINLQKRIIYILRHRYTMGMISRDKLYHAQEFLETLKVRKTALEGKRELLAISLETLMSTKIDKRNLFNKSFSIPLWIDKLPGKINTVDEDAGYITSSFGIRAVEERMKSAKQKALVTLKEKYPSLVIAGQLNQISDSSDSIFDKRASGWGLWMGVKLPVFDAGRNEYRYLSTKDEYFRLRERYREAIVEYVADFKEDFNNIQISRKKIDNVARELSLLKKKSSIFRDRYKQGVLSLYEYLEKKRTAILREVDLYRYKLDFVQGKLSLWSKLHSLDLIKLP